MSKLYPHRAKPFKGLAAFDHVGKTRRRPAAVLLSFGQQIRGR